LLQFFILIEPTFGANQLTSMHYMQSGRLELQTGKENHQLQLSLYGFFAQEVVTRDASMRDVRRFMMTLRTGGTD
jgi:hypothetical protein